VTRQRDGGSGARPVTDNRNSKLETRKSSIACRPYFLFVIRYSRLCLLQLKIENLKSKIGSIGNRKWPAPPALLPIRYWLLPPLSSAIENRKSKIQNRFIRQSKIENGLIAVLCHSHASSSTNGINKIEGQEPRFGFATASFISPIFNMLTAFRPLLRVRLRVRSDNAPLFSIS
jgi:hypothetical protein